MNNDLRNELKTQKSFLHDIPKNYFVNREDVPNGFFDKMEDRFFEKLQSQPSEPKSISIFQKNVALYRVAAVLVFAIVGISMFTIYNQNSKKDNIQLSHNEVISYLESEDMYDNEEIKSNSTIESLDKIPDEVIINYIIENESEELKKTEAI